MNTAPQLFTASVTPFTTPAGGVDHAWIPLHLRWMESQGVDGVVPCGTTGEGPSLSVAERQAIFDTVLAHRGKLRVFAGTGANALTDTIALTRYALERGAEAALVVPPFYFKNLTDEGLLAYYRAVCDALPPNGRILLYHIPPVSHIPIPTAVIDGLLQSHPDQIYGLKDSGGDAEHTAMLAKRYPSLKIFTGSAPLLARALSDGAAGGIFALANAFPAALRAVFTAHQAGGETDAAQKRAAALMNELRKHTVIPALKAVLPYLADMPHTSARLPLADMSRSEGQALYERFQALLND